MARKKAPPAPPPPSRERVSQALRSGNFNAAVEIARALQQISPSAENLALHKAALTAAAAFFADRDKVLDFNRVMDEADRLDSADAAWIAERACLLAKGGRLADALMRADDATRPRVLGFAADRALRLQSKDFLPDDLHAGFDAIVNAFKKYEHANDNAAREALEAIGLRSPFLEWKVFLRGLLAYGVNDDARAQENFARLDSSRLPSRLAAPFRAAIDSAWKATLPSPVLGELQALYSKLNASPLVEKFRDIARHLGRDKPLIPVFRAAESLVPQLKLHHSQLIPRLANCLYHAILQQGQPEDLPRYRKVFGNPPDDPHFFKLQAIVAEHIDNFEMVHTNWKKFDEWLAAKPAGWSEALLKRARATVWQRMGDNAETALEYVDEDAPDIFGLFDPPSRKKKKPKPLDPPMLECYRRAVEFAPDWPDAVSDLFEALLEAKKPDEAEVVVRRMLDAHPDNIEALSALGNELQRQGRAAEASELRLRASAVNPLDKVMRRLAANGILSHARSLLIQSKAKAIPPLFEQHRDFLNEFSSAGRDAISSVAALKLRQPEEAAALQTKAMAYPSMRLSIAYRIMVDSQLAKLKPAEKKAAEKRFADELALSPSPMEVNLLLLAFELYEAEGVTYRGQKSHEKKLLLQVGRCLEAKVPDQEFELLGEILQHRLHWKQLRTLADSCITRFDKNPAFPLFRAEVGLALGERTYYAEQRLRRAKSLAEASPEPRHRALLPKIEELLKTVAVPLELFDSFFGGR